MDDALYENKLFDGRYRLMEKKGQGSYGEVWKALDEHLDMIVAIKIYNSLGQEDNVEFKSEFKTTFQLNHPNLLTPSYFGLCGDRAYVVMPYCSAVATQLIGCIDESKFWHFVNNVAKGLAYLHSVDIVHHDIKPDNILIGEDGNFMISDFGISKKIRSAFQRNIAHDEATEQSEFEPVGGSLAYMAPEMFLDDPFSVKASDIWAFGVTLFEIVTGELPFFGKGGAMQNNGGTVPAFDYSYMSDSVKQLIGDCLAKEPWDRPTAQEIANYTKILFDESVDHPEWTAYFEETRQTLKQTSDPKPEPVVKRRLWWIPAAAAAIIGIVVAWWWFNNNSIPNQDKQSLVIIPEETLPTDTVEMPLLAEATYLTVNGSENPKLNAGSNETQKTVPVMTDGSSFTIELPKDCTWLSVVETTDSNFVLRIASNENIKGRSDKIKVISGDLTIEIPVYQSPKKEKEKEQKSKLVPATSGN